MSVDLAAQANIHGQTIDIRWISSTDAPTPPQWVLVRRKRAFPTSIKDGVSVLDITDFPVLIPSTTQQPSGTTLTVSASQDADNGSWTYTYAVTDAAELTSETIYYYTLFDNTGNAVGRVSAVANKSYEFADLLYRLLPGIYRLYDEPSPDQRGTGQLRHLLEIFGLTLDQIRSSAEVLRDRHNILDTRSDFLPHLAQWIAWDLDLNLDEISQRNEILRAPEIYRGIGTLPTLAALVNRATGWKCLIKEYVHNVCLSNAPELLHLWEIWETQYDPQKQSWLGPTPVTRTEDFDGRPFRVRDQVGAEWLFWRSNRRGKQEIWRQGLDAGNTVLEPITISPRDDPDNPLVIAESFAVLAADPDLWLFFDSGQPGHRDLWATNLADVSSPDTYRAVALFNGLADDSYPAAATLQGQIRLFWQSNRSGTTDLWTCAFNNGAWGKPSKVTTNNPGNLRTEKPAVVVDGQDRLWLFFCRNDQDNRRRLYCQTSTDGQTWDTPARITDGPFDDLPTAIAGGGKQIQLFWQAKDQGEHWQIWSKLYDGSLWGSAVQVSDHPAEAKDPMAAVDSTGQLHVYFRSQRRAYPTIAGQTRYGGYPYLSCTVDTKNPEMVSLCHTPQAFENRIHYTYDTGTGNGNWCARNTVGVYLTPVTDDALLLEQGRSLAEDLVRRYLPIQVRVIFIIEPPVYRELFYTYDFPEEQPQRLIEEQFSDRLGMVERYPAVQDNYADTFRDWIWLFSLDKSHLDGKTVDFKTNPPVTFYRTWQTGVSNKLDGHE